MKSKLLLVVATGLALAACQTTPTYSAATSPNAAGYSETQIESNRYTVTYRAPGGADAQTLQIVEAANAFLATLDEGQREARREHTGAVGGPPAHPR